MDTSTVTTASRRPTARTGAARAAGITGITGFAHRGVRPRRAARPVDAGRPVGAARLRDPRRDLNMFDLEPAVSSEVVRAGEPLAPLVPPVISEPSRRLARRTRGRVAGVTTQVHPPSRSAVGLDARFVSQAADMGSTESTRRTRRGARLTTRGRAVVLAAVIGGIALCSAITVGQSDARPDVESTHVVARAGESVEGLAERAAQGRDVQDVAESIRAANGLADGEMPDAGEVLVVPGS